MALQDALKLLGQVHSGGHILWKSYGFLLNLFGFAGACGASSRPWATRPCALEWPYNLKTVWFSNEFDRICWCLRRFRRSWATRPSALKWLYPLKILVIPIEFAWISCQAEMRKIKNRKYVFLLMGQSKSRAGSLRGPKYRPHRANKSCSHQRKYCNYQDMSKNRRLCVADLAFRKC